MNIGFIGLGKLGLPVALAVERAGHTVRGFDPNPMVPHTLATRKLPYQERGADALLATTRIEFGSMSNTVQQSDLVFIAVQTPHEPQYEGATRLPKTRADFDYRYLKAAVLQVNITLRKPTPVVVISTVLPGTLERDILPLLGPHFQLCYNPFFIAMGTTIDDFCGPEFVLLGTHHAEAERVVREFYATIHSAPIFATSIRNAELIKVLYNTFISTKIGFINTAMELCHACGADVDAVSDALSLGTNRLISARYLRGGMGDGGGCHPRDNIALSWLAQTHGLSFDLFGALMHGRELQTEWLASLIQQHRRGRPIVLLGKAFKRGTNITTGSPALLLSAILRENNVEYMHYDPHTGDWPRELPHPALYFLSANHEDWYNFTFKYGDTILDPWGMLDRDKLPSGVTYIPIGRHAR